MIKIYHSGKCETEIFLADIWQFRNLIFGERVYLWKIFVDIDSFDDREKSTNWFNDDWLSFQIKVLRLIKEKNCYSIGFQGELKTNLIEKSETRKFIAIGIKNRDEWKLAHRY